jgi:hypothetical protein
MDFLNTNASASLTKGVSRKVGYVHLGHQRFASSIRNVGEQHDSGCLIID